ncbi:hypothetical protein [Paraburkholderia unamae]|uniref:Uncharacterized protein n=1 Tax=Paraburkholderia unamae TaxID=219649 RepID=A0ACC6RWL4_9BURK
MRHYSTTDMIKRLTGLVGTKDLTDWESNFVTSVERQMNAGRVTMLTDKQIERLDELHSKHFA